MLVWETQCGDVVYKRFNVKGATLFRPPCRQTLTITPGDLRSVPEREVLSQCWLSLGTLTACGRYQTGATISSHQSCAFVRKL
jgi:hypothetical protein